MADSIEDEAPIGDAANRPLFSEVGTDQPVRGLGLALLIGGRSQLIGGRSQRSILLVSRPGSSVLLSYPFPNAHERTPTGLIC
jgi:hypothetical protein